MSKTQSFYQSILQNSTLVVKVSGKICDNQQSIENVIGDIKELLSTISKLKVVLVFGFGRQLDHYMKNVPNYPKTNHEAIAVHKMMLEWRTSPTSG